MATTPTLTIGQTVCDMHGRNFATHEDLRLVGQASRVGRSNKFDMRNPIEWLDVSEGQGGFWKVLDNICRVYKDRMYINKLLVVIGEPLLLTADNAGWMAAAYSYDGRRCGICEVRVRG